MNNNLVAITYSEPVLQIKAEELSNKLKLPLVSFRENSGYNWLLIYSTSHLKLHHVHSKLEMHIDFLAGKLGYRMQHLQHEIIAKAIGFKKNKQPTVIDATAGLGRDGFLLGLLGCKIMLIERSSIIAALLEDALIRSKKQFSLDIELINTDSINYLNQLNEKPDIIYLDPMYPHRNKSALVKKEMRLIRELVGDDNDAEALFNSALKAAKERVIVKRPLHANTLTSLKPDFVIKSKTQRFDVYKVSN